MYTDDFISYIRSVKRYSERTCSIYCDILRSFSSFLSELDEGRPADDEMMVSGLTREKISRYLTYLNDKGLSPRTRCQHISALSSFCRYLLGRDIIKDNPAAKVRRPEEKKSLPVFYRKKSIEQYFTQSAWFAGEESLLEFQKLWQSEDRSESACKMIEEFYNKRLSRLIISILFQSGIRRAELISLKCGSADLKRLTLTVTGKGDKMRKIPLTSSLCKEISLYLSAVKTMLGRERGLEEPLLVTFNGNGLYPVLVDRTVKNEFAGIDGMTGRKSPHALRHTVATELLDDGADIYSIKELLGHSSLAATQVYTHTGIEQLKNVYSNAHPRAKRGGNNGD
ncbi:MAG: tyrosine-type recombinase/integrase [Candidatus Cryptobacteroides sp.]